MRKILYTICKIWLLQWNSTKLRLRNYIYIYIYHMLCVVSLKFARVSANSLKNMKNNISAKKIWNDIEIILVISKWDCAGMLIFTCDDRFCHSRDRVSKFPKRLWKKAKLKGPMTSGRKKPATPQALSAAHWQHFLEFTSDSVKLADASTKLLKFAIALKFRQKEGQTLPPASSTQPCASSRLAGNALGWPR